MTKDLNVSDERKFWKNYGEATSPESLMSWRRPENFEKREDIWELVRNQRKLFVQGQESALEGNLFGTPKTIEANTRRSS